MTDRDSALVTARLFTRRGLYRARRALFYLPVAVALLVAYSPRGLARLVATLARYLYDYDSAQVRHEHAGRTETAEYVKAQNVRRANLRARWMVAGTLGTIVIAPALAWTAPSVLSALVGFGLFWWIVKLIPGRGLAELAVGLVVAGATWWCLPWALALIPAPPWWVLVSLATALVLALGWHGRPARPLVKPDDSVSVGPMEKPSAPSVIDALVRLSIAGLTDKTREEVRVFAPGVARGRAGYHLALELPAGVPASAVMDKREEFAAALRRELGTVWPTKGPRHPGHLVVYISDLPMATAPQSRWRVGDGRELDIFAPMPLFTDQEGRWRDLTLAYNQIVVGGAPGFGKSFAVRELGVAVAFDPRVRITTLDGKGNGDLRPLRLVAHGFFEGDEPDEIEEQLAAVRAMREEMRRRARFLRELPQDENPLSKSTSALVDRYPHLAPIVLLVDEVQVYTEHETKEVRDEFIRLFTDLVKRGRSAGIIPVFCTQKPDARALPSSIASNCSVRLCFRVNDWKSNDQVLGTGMHANGVKATLFDAADKGLAWLRGDGGDPMVVRTVNGLDAVRAEELTVIARQIRERRGLLTGQAAGDDAEQEEQQVSLLEDCRAVLDATGATAIHLAALREALAGRRATWANLDVAALGAMLRESGVKVATVWVRGGPGDGKGIKREWLNVAATSDEDPDPDS